MISCALHDAGKFRQSCPKNAIRSDQHIRVELAFVAEKLFVRVSKNINADKEWGRWRAAH